MSNGENSTYTVSDVIKPSTTHTYGDVLADASYAVKKRAAYALVDAGNAFVSDDPMPDDVRDEFAELIVEDMNERYGL